MPKVHHRDLSSALIVKVASLQEASLAKQAAHTARKNHSKLEPTDCHYSPYDECSVAVAFQFGWSQTRCHLCDAKNKAHKKWREVHKVLRKAEDEAKAAKKAALEALLKEGVL